MPTESYLTFKIVTEKIVSQCRVDSFERVSGVGMISMSTADGRRLSNYILSTKNRNCLAIWSFLYKKILIACSLI